MNSYNILILSVGRRVELVNCFKNAAKKLGIKSNIVGADCDETAPALYFTDSIAILPKITSPDYIDSIIEIRNIYDIALIVPTIDTDLILLAENIVRIEKHTNSKVLISDKEIIRICRDKKNTQSFLNSKGFKTPHIYLDDQLVDAELLPYPLFIKPVDGSSSINAYKVNNAEDLKAYQELIPNPMIQEYIDGDEYTIDAFLDFNSSIVSVVPRLRIATRSGEISKGKIIKDREIINEVIRLLEILKPIGHITIQCIKTKKGIVFIEINPRFGGGAPMSIKAGADSCENLYKLLAGKTLDYNEDYQEDLLFLRFDNSICLNGNMEIIEVN